MITPAGAQRREVLPPGRYLTTVPFTVLNGGIVLGRVLLDDFTDSLNFIFDTGCGGASLDSMTAANHKLKPTPSLLFVRGIGGELPQRLLENRRISMAGITLDSLTMQVNDYATAQ